MLSSRTKTANILLQTARVRIIGKNNKSRLINILFDKGSQLSFVTEDLCKELQIPLHKPHTLNVNHFGSSEYHEINSSHARIKLMSHKGPVQLPVLTVPKISGQVNQVCKESDGLNLKGLDLFNANIKGAFELLIGCDNYWNCVTGG